MNPQSTLARRHLPSIDGFCADIAQNAAQNRVLAPLLDLLCAVLRRIFASLDQLFLAWESGSLPAPVERPATPSTTQAPRAPRTVRHRQAARRTVSRNAPAAKPRAPAARFALPLSQRQTPQAHAPRIRTSATGPPQTAPTRSLPTTSTHA